MSDSQKDRVDRIVDKLARVRAQKLKCFGSESHCFRLNPPLDEAKILEFESRHGIHLPPDYRAFLQFAGNGGAEPYYGLYPLENWNDFAEWVIDDPIDGFLALPCPLYPELPRDDDWEEQISALSPYQGTLSLGSQGCTYMMQLVVTGAYAGRVVYVDADGQAPYMVCNSDFLEWYERWLDELLAGYNTNWFGIGIGGTESDLVAGIEDRQTTDTARAEAAEALSRLPGLSDDSKSRIQRFVFDSVDRVRAAICRAFRTFELHCTEETISTLLKDSSPLVREEAVRMAMQRDQNQWSRDVLMLLHEEDNEDVAKTAFFKLKDADALPNPDLLRLVSESSHEGLRYLAAHAVHWEPGDEELLLGLLNDRNAHVRFYATLGIRKLGAKNCVSAAVELLDREKDARVIGSVLKMLGEFGGGQARATLLAWTSSTDDFHRLDAVDGLCKLGDTMVAPVAEAMLQESRPPRRVDEDGCLSMIASISTLVAKSLRESPSTVLRRIGKRL